MRSITCPPHVFCLCRHEGESRYIACQQLRGDIDDARAMAVASGMLRASALPPSCAHLKKPEQLQLSAEEWSISWTGMPMRHKQSGLVR
jgi:antirestriction protein